jgi:gamma-glutamylaminecyclotransferase
MQGTRHSFAVAQRPRGWCNHEPIEPRPRKVHPMPTLVFVFGTLKQAFQTPPPTVAPDGPATSAPRPRYPLFLVGERHVPWLLNAPGTGLPVIGEVYAVDEATLRDMDALERVGHPDGYVRQGITVVPAGVEPGTPFACRPT